MRTVFVSSTSEDLHPYRQAAKDVILDLDCHPVMMEHFGADGSVGTVEACKQRVAGADLVLAILGWRLGWGPGPEVGGDGKRSITQIEIETAKALGKPVLFLLANDQWPGKLWERKTEPREQMEALRNGADRLAVFFAWEPVEVGATETLPLFRGKVRQELLRHWQTDSPKPIPLAPPIPRYPNDQIRALSEALTEAHVREQTVITSGGDAKAVREEILDLRRKLREGGRLKPGDLLAGRFQLIDSLGKGGFATVWKAFDLTRRELVAVKVLHGQYAEDRTRLERFFRGARKMAELHHQGIVRVLEERLDEGGFHFFVMEYLEGGDLREAVLGGHIPAERVVPLLRQVATALQFAHDHGVVHRDIKPANILLGAAGEAKLADFDLVRALDTSGGTLGGGMLGTFLYTAPECLSAPQDAGATADVYSFAMTAAFCFLGKDLPPESLFAGNPFIESLPCAQGIRKALRKGVAIDAAERFQSVAALMEAIEQGLAPVEAEKPAPSQRVPTAKPKPEESGQALLSYLEKQVASLPEADRSAAVLMAIERALPIGAEDLKTLGIVAWALDYFPGRSSRAGDREAASAFRKRAFAPLRERRPPPPLPGRDDSKWAAIPGGSFQMGSPAGKGFDFERPTHHVTIWPFRLGIYPVTTAEYARLLGKSSKVANLPATEVDWYTAYAYAAWLGGRLPTEAEWEYAARGGTEHEYANRQGRETTLDKVGWYIGNAKQRPGPVGGREPNPWGLCDMIGNVWEWAADWYGAYSAGSQSDPWGPPSGEARVLRGGSAWFGAVGARAAYRRDRDPGFEDVNLGFRVALPAGPKLSV